MSWLTSESLEKLRLLAASKAADASEPDRKFWREVWRDCLGRESIRTDFNRRIITPKLVKK